MQQIIKLLKTKFKTLKTKANNLKKEIPNATTLNHINQHNTDKQVLEENLEMFRENTRFKWFRNNNCFEYENQ